VHSFPLRETLFQKYLTANISAAPANHKKVSYCGVFFIHLKNQFSQKHSRERLFIKLIAASLQLIFALTIWKKRTSLIISGSFAKAAMAALEAGILCAQNLIPRQAPMVVTAVGADILF
jgi:hypothetical protein